MLDHVLKGLRSGRFATASIGLTVLCLGLVTMIACQSQTAEAGELTVTYYFIPR